MVETTGGTVTLLFTDLVGSTALLERLGDDRYEALRRTHFRLLRAAVAGHQGHEVKNLGDGVMTVFASAVSAVGCAVAMQQAVHRHNQDQDEDKRLHVRIGLQVGEPIQDEEDYFGKPVVMAERLCRSANGGQIIASDLVRGLVGSRGEHTFLPLQPLVLKGFAQPVSACEVAWEPAPDAGRPTVPLPAPLDRQEWGAFVGREQELERLGGVWERARGGRRQLAVLGGEPGIGKTRLAAELACRTYQEGATVLYGRCYEDAPVPYQAFAEVVRHFAGAATPDELQAHALAGGTELARSALELAELLGDAAKARTEPDTPPDPLLISQTVTAFIGEVCRAGPAVLVLDDLHWADGDTLQMLTHVAHAPEQWPLLLLVTYREADLTRTHPLGQALAELQRDPAFLRLRLRGLTEPAVGDLVGRWAGSQAPQPFIRAVHEQTEGNPFFIEELLRHLTETDAIRQEDDQLVVTRPIEQLGIPEGVKQVIGRRLARLSEDCNSVLTVASVIGREFGLDALERASDLSSDRLVALLEEAVAHRVVAEQPQVLGRYRFAHTLIYEALRDELTTTRRVRLYGQTLQYADSDGVKLAYEVLGATGPYMIVTGVSNCPAVRTRMHGMAKHWERVSRCCRLVLYDRRGVGFSAAPERGYSLRASVEDVRAVLDAVGADRAIVWGTVDGGPLALAFAGYHPQRVAGLVLAGTTAKYASSEDYPYGVSPTMLQQFQLGSVDQADAISQLVSDTRRAVPAEDIRDVLGRVPHPVWPKLVGGIAVADARSLLPQISARALIIHDPDNSYLPVEAAKYLHDHLPGSILEVTPEYDGQLPFGEGLYGVIEAFIKEVIAPKGP